MFALRPIYNIGYVAYFELNIDYIIETYCVNKEKPKLQCKGKCHLAKQLTLDTSQNSETSNYLSSFYQAFFPVFFKAYELKEVLLLSDFILQNNWHYSKSISDLFQDYLDRPPQV